jgi:NAD(P)-dependent dehydrogenase (short-subunit alcohol dehydrogenase family)
VDEFRLQQPLERLLHPEEIAEFIVWLAGPAGSAMTGAELPIDGGLSV